MINKLIIWYGVGWVELEIENHFQRFLPSEFGNDVDRTRAVEPAKSTFAIKAKIRRAIEAEGIPYTYVSSNYFAGYSLPTLVQPGAYAPPPPKDKIVIYGDGNAKGTLLLLLLIMI